MKKLLTSSAVALLPLFALAQTAISETYISSIITALSRWISALVPLLITLAVVAFFYGLVRYIWGGTDDSKVKGKQMMIWGVITIAVMISIWGLVTLLQNITRVGGTTSITVPTVPTVPGGTP